MPRLYIFNKPFNVLSQFTDSSGRTTLADYIKIPKIYPAGRLDYDSEGLLILTGDGNMQARIADPKHKLNKTYWVQVEGIIDNESLSKLEKGIHLKDGLTKPAKAKRISEPALWPRTPPIRYRKDDQTSWIELTISEGKNRQVRRMTAAAGHPTLRLVRYSIGPWTIEGIRQSEYKTVDAHLPKSEYLKPHNKLAKTQRHTKPKSKQQRNNVRKPS